MTVRRRTWIGIAATAAAVFAGGGSSAIARDVPGADPAESPYQHTLTVAEQKQIATTMLDRAAQWLMAVRQRAAADDRLTGQQRTELLAKIDTALTRIGHAVQAVGRATTTTEVRDALMSAGVPLLVYPQYLRPHVVRHDLRPRHALRADPAHAALHSEHVMQPRTVVRHTRFADPNRCRHHWDSARSDWNWDDDRNSSGGDGWADHDGSWGSWDSGWR